MFNSIFFLGFFLLVYSYFLLVLILFLLDNTVQRFSLYLIPYSVFYFWTFFHHFASHFNCIISRSKDLWKILMFDLFMFDLFRSSASSFSSQYLLLFFKSSSSCVLLLILILLTPFTIFDKRYLVRSYDQNWHTEYWLNFWPTRKEKEEMLEDQRGLQMPI